MDTRIPDKTADIREMKSTPRVTPQSPKTQFKEVLAATAVKGAESAMAMLPGGPVMALALRGMPAVPMSMNTMGNPNTGVTPSIGGISNLSGASAARPSGVASLASSSSASGASSASGSSSASTAASTSAEGPGVTASTGTDGIAAASGLGSDNTADVQSSLQQSQDMNIYYLQIQEEVNAQNRSFTALSNVIKAEHDTVKTAIGNIH